MNDKSPKYKLSSHWIIFSLFMLLLIFPIHHFLGQIKDQNLNQATHVLSHEIELLGNIVETLLQSGQYDSIQSVFDEWAINNPDVDSISLTTANGYQIADYKSKVACEHFQCDSLVIKDGYSGMESLHLRNKIVWI